MNGKVTEVVENDLKVLSDMFWAHISSDPDYISHGEMQMGVGVAAVEDGKLSGRPAPDGKAMWDKYIMSKFRSEDAAVMKFECDGKIAGFCVAEIMEDGAEPFGMVCDVLVDKNHRGQGAGGILLDAAVSWLRSKGVSGIYLESGKNNASAHEFFEKRGFRHISDIFRLL